MSIFASFFRGWPPKNEVFQRNMPKKTNIYANIRLKNTVLLQFWLLFTLICRFSLKRPNPDHRAGVEKSRKKSKNWKNSDFQWKNDEKKGEKWSFFQRFSRNWRGRLGTPENSPFFRWKNLKSKPDSALERNYMEIWWKRSKLAFLQKNSKKRSILVLKNR